MKPRVIWLDDEINTPGLQPIMEQFKRNFDLIPCCCIEEFYKKSKALEWDAAILDVFNSDEKLSDFFNSVQYVVDEFDNRKWFVFSGKERLSSFLDGFEDILRGKAYSRTYASRNVYFKSQDEQLLIGDILATVQNSRKWAVESEYSKVLDIVSNRLERPECRQILLDILCSAGGVENIDYRVYYNSIRVILEWMFRACRKYGLLHDRCFDRNDRINLTDASMFMAGLPAIHSGVVCEKAHFSRLISKHVKFILRITGGASHTSALDTEDYPNLSEYWDEIDTPYLLYSLTYMLCDVLIWFDKYVSKNNDVERNRSLWRKLRYSGKLVRDDDGNWFAGDCLLPYKQVERWISSGTWREGDIIVVSDATYNTDTSLPYKLIAKRFKLQER